MAEPLPAPAQRFLIVTDLNDASQTMLPQSYTSSSPQ